MSLLYEKSRIWRWIVASSKASKPFFLGFSVICLAIPSAMGYAVMSFTSSNDEQLREQLSKTSRLDSQLMGRVNKERLGQLLSEIKNKENTEDRYAAALRGETLTGTADARIHGGAGTSWKPLSETDGKEGRKDGSTAQ